MGVWPHAPLSLDLALGYGNSVTSEAIPRRNWRNGPGCIAITSAELSGESETWLSKISLSWQRPFPFRQEISSSISSKLLFW